MATSITSYLWKGIGIDDRDAYGADLPRVADDRRRRSPPWGRGDKTTRRSRCSPSEFGALSSADAQRVDAVGRRLVRFGWERRQCGNDVLYPESKSWLLIVAIIVRPSRQATTDNQGPDPEKLSILQSAVLDDVQIGQRHMAYSRVPACTGVGVVLNRAQPSCPVRRPRRPRRAVVLRCACCLVEVFFFSGGPSREAILTALR
ncbi:hypothetical protein F4780DRAFT_31722 [Xylariomycetidae sp. FL0641]|nr:hypothetical protein F4780DRAFT_31722 [Xylariomycetidae sp. FL0641]